LVFFSSFSFFSLPYSTFFFGHNKLFAFGVYVSIKLPFKKTQKLNAKLCYIEIWLLVSPHPTLSWALLGEEFSLIEDVQIEKRFEVYESEE